MNKEDILRMAQEAFDVEIDARGRETFSGDEYGIERFAAIVAEHERKRIAQKIEQLPFGDTSASFAIYVRENA